MTYSTQQSLDSGERTCPIVSVIIPTLDRPQLLDAALASVAAQDLAGDIEAIVINDGGRPVTTVARRWSERIAIQLIDMDRHCGPAPARNAGIELATGKYIAFLDDDDLFLPGHLATGCAPLEDGIVDFVYLGAVVASERLQAAPSDLGAFPLKAYRHDQRILAVANYLHTGSVIVRNFRHTPVRFDPALDVCEDWDLWLALTTSLGYRVQFVDRVTSVYHQVPAISGLVSSAQLVAPSRFSAAREYIQAKWPARDPLASAYREWMTALEHARSELIMRNVRLPNLLFDEILAYLHPQMSREQQPDYDAIGQLLSR